MTTVIIAVGSEKANQNWAKIMQAQQPTWNICCWDQVGSTQQADFAVVWSPEQKLFEDQPKLKAIFNVGAGVDGIDFTQVPAALPVYRVEDAGMAVQMAEYAVHGVLLATQRFQSYAAAQKNKEWRKQPPIYREQWPIGIMGFGQIGKKVAQILQQLGYPVSAWVRTERTAPDGISVFAGSEQFVPFLAQSRILINVLPLTEQTQGIINAENLVHMPAAGFVINMGRGPHVIDNDLLAAIDSGHLMGALLDVFHTEPLPQDHAFWTHPAIHITPHISGGTLLETTASQILSKIQAFEQAQPVSGLVDRERQY